MGKEGRGIGWYAWCSKVRMVMARCSMILVIIIPKSYPDKLIGIIIPYYYLFQSYTI